MFPSKLEIEELNLEVEESNMEIGNLTATGESNLAKLSTIGGSTSTTFGESSSMTINGESTSVIDSNSKKT